MFVNLFYLGSTLCCCVYMCLFVSVHYTYKYVSILLSMYLSIPFFVQKNQMLAAQLRSKLDGEMHFTAQLRSDLEQEQSLTTQLRSQLNDARAVKFEIWL